MKKIVCLFLAALMLVGALSLAAFADEPIVYIAYNGGNNDANDGLTADAPKRGLGQPSQTGAVSVVKTGGSVVIVEKLYIANDYTLKAFGPITFTANDGTKDFKNTEADGKGPKAGVMKFASNAVMSVASDLTLDDMILYQEGGQNTFVVKSGATLTVTDKIICTSKKDYYTKIEVENGGTAIINGGIFSSVTGDGKIEIGAGATVLEDGTETPATPATPVPAGPQSYCFLDINNGDDANGGTSASDAVKSYGKGCMTKLTEGGTLVVSGKSYINTAGMAENTYKLPILPNPLTITSFWDGKDYKNREPAKNPDCAFKFSSGGILEIGSDVIFDNIILFQEGNQNIIHVTNGATLTVTDKVVLMSKQTYHFIIKIDEGATAILSEEAQKTFDIEGGGKVETYVSDEPAPVVPEPQKTVVKLTVGSTTAYLNDEAKTLDAAPINRASRVMLPVRFLAEAFGAEVAWDDATKTATLTTETRTILVTVGAPEMRVNGAAVSLDSPALIENSRTYMPVRAIANALGVLDANIQWDGATNTATLTK